LAAAGGNDTAINFLNDNKLLSSIDSTTAGAEHYSSLQFAATFNQPSTARLLKRLGAHLLDLTDKVDEQTALHHAAGLGWVKVVTVLLEEGCQPNLIDANGMPPKLLAIENKHGAVATLLGLHLDTLERKVDAAPIEDQSDSISKFRGGEVWRIPLARNDHMQKVMTGGFSLYAIHNECAEAARTILAETWIRGFLVLERHCKDVFEFAMSTLRIAIICGALTE
jgi:hypothetical protein